MCLFVSLCDRSQQVLDDVIVCPAVSFQLTFRERRAVMAGLVSVFRHLIVGGLLVALDFLVFWILDQVHHQVTEDIVARGEPAHLPKTTVRFHCER